MVALAVVATAAAIAGVVRVAAGTPADRPPAVGTRQYCGQLVVPAYFYSAALWARAVASRPPPDDVILDISGEGAGNGPDPYFQALVRQVKARGARLLGYVSTVDGRRPAAQVEAEVRNYKAWYGVTDIFLDRVTGLAPRAAYYRQLVNFVHQYSAGSSVWLNPGEYPDRSYMSIGDVVMVFEGTYAQYLGLHVPGWAGEFPASRFAHTVYATPGSDLADVLKLAGGRRAGHVYVTDGSGSNPYDVLPSYWPREAFAASAGCGRR